MVYRSKCYSLSLIIPGSIAPTKGWDLLSEQRLCTTLTRDGTICISSSSIPLCGFQFFYCSRSWFTGYCWGHLHQILDHKDTLKRIGSARVSLEWSPLLLALLFPLDEVYFDIYLTLIHSYCFTSRSSLPDICDMDPSALVWHSWHVKTIDMRVSLEPIVS